MKLTPQQALRKACDLVGGPKAMAYKLDVSRQAVQLWLKNGLPLQRVLSVEAATNGKVSRAELCPYLYDEGKPAA